ncbi:PAS domain-containing protein [Massilia sp. Root351]|jgi:CheY-like chemotaxis protein|uniref:PAS domain-containing protein n=1 Tax=Massilia sp. Root351 TaxID=1736522 RepID=UPI0009EC042F|nr:PAS domain-containing protein [Massilia sp. Root351]
MDVKEDTSADWMIEEDMPANADQSGPAPVLAPWRVLIVDDDVDVHVVTKFSLSNACFQGRRLSFLHAYSGDEALHILRTTPDVALVLLDVIMETSEAGLKVARQIRDELHNKLVRIVLRTGQPGQALEHSIILDYDINDFWCKSDLTTRKLFTTVISSLRGYANLVEADRHLAELQAQLDNSVRFVLDEQRRILGLNGLAAALLGAPEEALLGRKLVLSAVADDAGEERR